jgi:hypothetical protein
MRRMRILAWDGLLPLGIVMIPTALEMLKLDGILIGLVVFLTILAAALIRAHVAHIRIHEICDGRPTFLRQLALAMAIVILLLFESIASILQNVQPREPEPYVVLLLLYLAYLVIIVWALRPLPRPPVDPDDDRVFLDARD